jgi:hypothetical protein
MSYVDCPSFHDRLAMSHYSSCGFTLLVGMLEYDLVLGSLLVDVRLSLQRSWYEPIQWWIFRGVDLRCGFPRQSCHPPCHRQLEHECRAWRRCLWQRSCWLPWRRSRWPLSLIRRRSGQRSYVETDVSEWPLECQVKEYSKIYRAPEQSKAACSMKGGLLDGIHGEVCFGVERLCFVGF